MKAPDTLREKHQVMLRVLDCLAAAIDKAGKKKELETDPIHKV